MPPPERELRRTLRPTASLGYSLAALTCVVASGTLGFTLIEGWPLLDSLYMTVMTVTTVGYGPPLPLTPAGRNFSIFFMVVGVGAAGYLLSTAIQSLVRTEVLAAYGARRRHREMSRLRDHYVICGAGRVGRRIVGEMRRAGAAFVAVESDATRAAELGLAGAQVLVGDATLDETLLEAGVARAAGLASCLPDDAANLYVVLTARTLNPSLRIVARAVEESAEPKLARAGADRVIAPTIIGSHRMAQALLKPGVADFMDSVAADTPGLAFEQVEVAPGSPLEGRRLEETDIRSRLDVVVAAVRRAGGEMVFNPPGDTQILAGDMLIGIGRAEAMNELTALARGARK